MNKEKKYLICPGIVISQHDGEENFISVPELMRLYGVNPNECFVVNSKETALGLEWENYVVLRPRYDGNYSLCPPEPKH